MLAAAVGSGAVVGWVVGAIAWATSEAGGAVAVIVVTTVGELAGGIMAPECWTVGAEIAPVLAGVGVVSRCTEGAPVPQAASVKAMSMTAARLQMRVVRGK